jgi:hypothetical protein
MTFPHHSSLDLFIILVITKPDSTNPFEGQTLGMKRRHYFESLSSLELWLFLLNARKSFDRVINNPQCLPSLVRNVELHFYVQ